MLAGTLQAPREGESGQIGKIFGRRVDSAVSVACCGT